MASFMNHPAMDQNVIGTNDMVPDWMTAEHSTGTTIMAVEYKDGVIVGADSRTTTGAYIANRVTDKLTKVTENIYCCRSGSAADTQAIADVVKYYIDLLSIQTGQETRVLTVAKMFQDTCYNYRDQTSAGIIVAGWDSIRGGQVYSIPLGGMMVRTPCAIGGSGSTYIYGYIDSEYKDMDRDKMTQDESLQFVEKAVSLAMWRDGSSGGIVRRAVINKDGVERFTTLANDLPKWSEH